MNWRWVPGFEGRYEVSDDGSVRSYMMLWGQKTREARLVKGTRSSGYVMFFLHGERGKVRRTGHSLVAAAFIGPCPEGLVINHKDGNRSNNNAGNLEYVTMGENFRHAHTIGLTPRGSKAWNAKLTEEMVLEARRVVAQGSFISVLAKRFGVNKNTLREAVVGRTWKHVT